jgi:hypothetical protein
MRLQITLYESVTCQAADLKDQAAKAKFWLPFEIVGLFYQFYQAGYKA